MLGQDISLFAPLNSSISGVHVFAVRAYTPALSFVRINIGKQPPVNELLYLYQRDFGIHIGHESSYLTTHETKSTLPRSRSREWLIRDGSHNSQAPHRSPIPWDHHQLPCMIRHSQYSSQAERNTLHIYICAATNPTRSIAASP
jgi:hypothetical protein